MVKAAHLCRRAGFGAPRDELNAVLEMGPIAAVDRFLQAQPERDEHYTQLFDTIRQGFRRLFSSRPTCRLGGLFRMQTRAVSAQGENDAVFGMDILRLAFARSKTCDSCISKTKRCDVERLAIFVIWYSRSVVIQR